MLANWLISGLHAALRDRATVIPENGLIPPERPGTKVTLTRKTAAAFHLAQYRPRAIDFTARQ
jgi:hypothetical protein